jgi:hypothetical protein
VGEWVGGWAGKEQTATLCSPLIPTMQPSDPDHAGSMHCKTLQWLCTCANPGILLYQVAGGCGSQPHERPPCHCQRALLHALTVRSRLSCCTRLPTLQQLHDFITTVIIPQCADKGCLDTKLGQCSGDIAGSASWVGCPGLDFVSWHTLVVCKEVCAQGQVGAHAGEFRMQGRCFGKVQTH